jgi:glucokinase
VRENRCTATNLPWTLDGGELARSLGLAELVLLNDLEAVGYGIDVLRADEILELQSGAARAAGNRAVIAAGTGLGEAGLYWDGSAHRPFATEGGHADFAPADERELDLHRFLLREHGRVSWERAVSGPGLVSLYRYLRQNGEIASAGEPPGIAAEMQRGDPAAVISRLAAAGESALCVRALELFVKLYGAEAGNLALKTMATGGLYIAGGIARKNLDWLAGAIFIEAFRAKGRMRPLLEAMPVRVILNDATALVGAARHAASGSG